MHKKPNYFLMVTSDAEDLAGRQVYATDLVLRRISVQLWPLYKGTKHRRLIDVGDICFFYVGGRGKNRLSFHSQATVKEKDHNPSWDSFEEIDEAFTPQPFIVLKLEKCIIYEHPKPIKPLMKKLGFIGDYPNWGVYMQGGVKLLSNDDANIIERA